MEARNFKKANVNFAKGQKGYQNLPAHRFILKDNVGLPCGYINTFSFKLNEAEVEQVIETGTIYIQVLTFNTPLQPICPSALNPFIEEN